MGISDALKTEWLAHVLGVISHDLDIGIPFLVFLAIPDTSGSLSSCVPFSHRKTWSLCLGLLWVYPSLLFSFP